jgi:hypothetical protein
MSKQSNSKKQPPSGESARSPPLFTPEQTRWIQDEITRQIVEAKQVIDREMDEQLAAGIKKVHEALSAEIGRQISSAIQSKIAPVAAEVASKVVGEAVANLDQRINENNRQIVVSGKNQLELVKKTTKELMMTVGQEITNAVYDRVSEEINTKVVPQMARMVQYVQYQTQDGGEVVTDYRRAVAQQAAAGEAKMLTNGGDTKHIITPHVRTFFTADD